MQSGKRNNSFIPSLEILHVSNQTSHQQNSPLGRVKVHDTSCQKLFEINRQRRLKDIKGMKGDNAI